MKKYILFLLLGLLGLPACATLQNYNKLSARDKAFYKLLSVENQNHNTFSALKSQQERDNYLKQKGYLQKYNALPLHVQKAVIEHEIVKGAPAFTVYMAAGKPIKQNKQVSMNEGETKTLFYIRCGMNAGANAGEFVPESGVCVAAMGSVFKSTVSPTMNKRDPLLAETMSYVVKIKAEKIVSVDVVEDIPR